VEETIAESEFTAHIPNPEAFVLEVQDTALVNDGNI
jgi:hypothetical protein